jgi:hypothetical protein
MQSFTGLIRVDDYDQSLRDVAMPFDEALQRSLYGNDACLLTICANTCAIVNGRGKFAFVDSHINSNVNRKGRRASCVSYFNCLQTLIRHVYDFAERFGGSTPRFEATGVKAAIIHVDPDNANYSTMVNRPLYSDIVKGNPMHKVCEQLPGVSDAGNFGIDTGYCSDNGQCFKREIESHVNDVIDVDANMAAQPPECLKRVPSYHSDKGKRPQRVKRVKTEIKSYVIDVDADTAKESFQSVWFSGYR